MSVVSTFWSNSWQEIACIFYFLYVSTQFLKAAPFFEYPPVCRSSPILYSGLIAVLFSHAFVSQTYVHILLEPLKCHKTNNWTTPRLHSAGLYHCSVNIDLDMLRLSDRPTLGEALSLCRSRTAEEWLAGEPEDSERKFPRGYFNNVYSCLRFLFPVLLGMLPARPFLLFLYHYCPLLSKKRHCLLWRQHPVCQQPPQTHLDMKWQTTSSSRLHFCIKAARQRWQISNSKLPFFPKMCFSI